MPHTPIEPRQLFAQETLSLVDWGGKDDAAVERLAAAMIKTLHREKALLAQVRERGRLDGLWAAIHMIRTQGEAINLQMFSPQAQAAIGKALVTHRPQVSSDDEARALAEEISSALDEMLTTFKATQ